MQAKHSGEPDLICPTVVSQSSGHGVRKHGGYNRVLGFSNKMQNALDLHPVRLICYNVEQIAQLSFVSCLAQFRLSGHRYPECCADLVGLVTLRCHSLVAVWVAACVGQAERLWSHRCESNDL